VTDGDRDSAAVLLVAGSLRHGGYTTRLLQYTAALLHRAVTSSDDVRTLPMYNADLDGEGATATVTAARQRVTESAGLLIATPQYNGTIPGGLKNWLDWMSRPFRAHVLIGKPIAVLGASPGSGGALPAVTWLRTTLESLGAVVVGDLVAIPNVVEQFDEHDTLRAEVDLQLQALAVALEAAITSSDGAIA
jgi:chromate reductase, NAD(P)H dehydrogenase (quinone)